MNTRNREQGDRKKIATEEEEIEQFIKKKEIQNSVLKKIIKKINMETKNPNKH
jgi:hypothetical protein